MWTYKFIEQFPYTIIFFVINFVAHLRYKDVNCMHDLHVTL